MRAAQFSNAIYAGGFRVSNEHLMDFRSKVQVPLIDDGYYTPPTERPPTHVSSMTTQVYENALYTGDPHQPKVRKRIRVAVQ